MLAIAGAVEKGLVAADIGTDHAQLPILLVKNGICPKVYACDVRRGPLAMAEENIRREELTDRIPVILSDGFREVPDDCECAVIAGMGYYTAVGILEEAEDRLGNLKQIIVQVNNDEYRFRAWLSSKHYSIRNELLIYENGKDYAAVVFDTKTHEPYSYEEQLLGPCLISTQKPAFTAYCTRKAEHIKKIIGLRGEDAQNADLLRDLEIFEKYTKK